MNKGADSGDNKENTHKLCNNVLLHIFKYAYVEDMKKYILLSKIIHRLIPLFRIQIFAACVWQNTVHPYKRLKLNTRLNSTINSHMLACDHVDIFLDILLYSIQ